MCQSKTTTKQKYNVHLNLIKLEKCQFKLKIEMLSMFAIKINIYVIYIYSKKREAAFSKKKI
jgi:hypothetical protein